MEGKKSTERERWKENHRRCEGMKMVTVKERCERRRRERCV